MATLKKKVIKKGFNQTKFNAVKKQVFPAPKATSKPVQRQGDVLSGYRKALQSGKTGGKGWGP